MDIKKRPTLGTKRAHRSELELEALVAKARLRAKHGPKRTAHSHVLAAALAHLDAVEGGHASSSLSHKLGRTISRGPTSG
jgi:hypothetical protein